ncbi:hypothetical protein BJV82DRAFT_716292, partial [Fennellomyces sp. T-0311]
GNTFLKHPTAYLFFVLFLLQHLNRWLTTQRQGFYQRFSKPLANSRSALPTDLLRLISDSSAWN